MIYDIITEQEVIDSTQLKVIFMLCIPYVIIPILNYRLYANVKKGKQNTRKHQVFIAVLNFIAVFHLLCAIILLTTLPPKTALGNTDLQDDYNNILPATYISRQTYRKIDSMFDCNDERYKSIQEMISNKLEKVVMDIRFVK